MSKKKTKLQIAQEQAENAVKETNRKIDDLGRNTGWISEKMNSIQQLFDDVRNMPSEKRLECERLKKIRLEWKQQVEKIESEYNSAVAKNAGIGAAGVGTGAAVAALGPTVAMGIATTFGVASTGTAISALSGAAATNAALAWLGGGALAAGGGGMVAGEAFLALAGPVGWAIAGVALISSAFMLLKGKSDKERLENIFTIISERDVKSYKLAIVEINERITRIIDEGQKLSTAIEQTKSFGLDYDLMTEAQQYELGSYVNLMNASTQLLVNPIMGLKEKYSVEDLKKYFFAHVNKIDSEKRKLIMFLANLLYEIPIDEKDKRLLWKALKGNKKFMESMGMKKKEFEFSVMETVFDALDYKYDPAKHISLNAATNHHLR